MKTTVKLAGILLMILLSSGATLVAQRGMRGNMDSTRMNRMKMGPGYGMMQKGGGPDSVMMRKMHQNMMLNMGPGMGMGRGIGSRNGSGMRGGMGHMPMNGKGMRPMRDMRAMGPVRPMLPERMISESLPNVTEKQKKDIADLRLKQQEEMKKLREETDAKMKTLRDSHKEAVLKLLTEEQKKFIESKQVMPAAAPVPAK